MQNEVEKFLPALVVTMNGTLPELHPALNLGPSEGLKTLKKKKITRLFLIFQPTMDYEHVDLRGEETVEHGN